MWSFERHRWSFSPVPLIVSSLCTGKAKGRLKSLRLSLARRDSVMAIYGRYVWVPRVMQGVGG